MHTPFDPQIIRRFDVTGPRYTSYPTADLFVEALDEMMTVRPQLAASLIALLARKMSLRLRAVGARMTERR